MRRVQCGLKDVILPSKWEALLNNLGHTCRKMKKYEEALNYHQQVEKRKYIHTSILLIENFITKICK